MKKAELLVVASSAVDTLYEDGEEVRKTKGGPAKFIADALHNAGVEFDSFFTPEVEVDIEIVGNEEVGKVSQIPFTLGVDLALVRHRYVLVSSVLNEIALTNFETYRGSIFIDAQGFVRDEGHDGEKKVWRMDEELLSIIECIKVTEEESNYIDKKQFDFLKRSSIVIITKGDKGGEIFIKGGETNYTVPKKHVVTDTLGAGDTFFACWVAEYIKTGDAMASLKSAINHTDKFLVRKHK